MNCLFTVDYEDHLRRIDLVNAVENVVKPSNRIMSFFEGFGVPVTFFCNAPELLAYRKAGHAAYSLLRDQVLDMKRRGHDVQFHFHPQWLSYHLGDGGWVDRSGIDFYQHTLVLDDYAVGFDLSLGYLRALCGEVFAYRAGGWLIEPLERNLPFLSSRGITVDSSVGGMPERCRHTRRLLKEHHNSIPPVPFDLGHGIVELPVARKRGARCDISSGKAGIESIHSFLGLGDQDSYVVVMGHCKQMIDCEHLGRLLQYLHDQSVRFCTFSNARDSICEGRAHAPLSSLSYINQNRSYSI